MSTEAYFFSTERNLKNSPLRIELIAEASMDDRTGFIVSADAVIPEYGTNILLLAPKTPGENWPVDSSETPVFVYVIDGTKFAEKTTISSNEVSNKIIDWGGVASLKIAKKWCAW